MKTRLTFFATSAVLLAIAVTPVKAIDGFSFVTVCDSRPSIFTGDTGRDALAEDLDQIDDNLPVGWPSPKFVFYVGDIDLPSVTKQAYLNSEVSDLCHVFIPGNHEISPTYCIQEVRDHYNPMVLSLPTGASVTRNSPTPTNDTMFMIEYENAAFITLDIYYDDDVEYWDPEGVLYDRVMNFVEDALNQTNKPVKFVFYHEPVFPDVRHVGDSLDDDARCDEFWDLLTVRGVTGTYVGHTHWSDMSDIGQGQKGMQGIFEIDAGCGGLMVGGNNEPVPTLIYTLVTSGGLCLHRRAQPASGRNWSGTVNYTDLSATDREYVVLIDTFEHSGTDLKYWVDYSGNNPDWSGNNEGRWWENAFDPSAAGWSDGILAVGYDTGGNWPWMNEGISPTGGVHSVFTRIPFEIPSQEWLDNFPWLQLGFDYDDAICVWLNGVEIYASENAPATNDFDQLATEPHSAAGDGDDEPDYTIVNISDFHDLLTTGTNLLVVANWNHSLTSTDLAAGVQLILKSANPPSSPRASNPNPTNEATQVDVDSDLSWAAGVGAVSHDVYLGTDFDAVKYADITSPEFMGNQTGTTYDPTLEPKTTYYWAIDEHDSSNGIIYGDVWSFTTFGCLSSTSDEYSDWLYWGKPDCWCYQRQCRGDADGIKTGPFWVAIPDQQIFTAAFNKTDTVLKTIPNGICADLDHKKTGPFRVAIPDLNIFRAYFNKTEENVPACDATPIITGPYNFWTSP